MRGKTEVSFYSLWVEIDQVAEAFRGTNNRLDRKITECRRVEDKNHELSERRTLTWRLKRPPAAPGVLQGRAPNT